MKLLRLHRVPLSNGLMFFYGQTDESSGFEVAMQIDTGSRDETDDINGVSHFLEHMMFRGSARHPDSITLAKAMEDFGGETNAMTGNESTVYWLRGASRKMDMALEVFADFFLNPNYADLDTERSIILQELAGDYNEEGDNIDLETLAMKALFQEHPLGFPIIGTEKVLKKITAAELEQKRAHFYTPGRCVLSLVASLPLEKVLPVVEKHFSTSWRYVPAGQQAPSRVLAPKDLYVLGTKAKPKDVFKLQNNPDNQYSLKLAFPTLGGSSRNVVLQTFLQRVLDDGISSRLPANIREKHGLVYDISCDVNSYSDVGVFSLDLTVSKDLLSKLLEKLQEELRKILDKAPTIEEVERVRFRYSFDLEMLRESPNRLVSREVWNHFLPQSLTLEDELAIVQSVSPAEILATAQQVFRAPRRAAVLVGPKARKKREHVEKFMDQLV